MGRLGTGVSTPKGKRSFENRYSAEIVICKWAT